MRKDTFNQSSCQTLRCSMRPLIIVVNTEGYIQVTAQYEMQTVNMRKVMRG